MLVTPIQEPLLSSLERTINRYLEPNCDHASSMPQWYRSKDIVQDGQKNKSSSPSKQDLLVQLEVAFSLLYSSMSTFSVGCLSSVSNWLKNLNIRD